MLIIGTIVVLVLAFIAWGMSDQNGNSNLATVGLFDQSIEDSVIKVEYSTKDFGLAINPSQILLETEFLPCDTTLETGFDYCLYYLGDEVEGGDFESAGMRIKKRPDLSSENTCLNTSPRRFEANLVPNTLKPQENVSTSVFSGLSDSGAGYVSTASLYRLFDKESKACYEFETKVIHKSDDPEDPISSRVQEDRDKLKAIFDSVLDRVLIAGDFGDVFP